MSEIWVAKANMQLPEFTVPPQTELNDHWQAYAGGNVVEAPGVYGAIRTPDKAPTKFASIDLCEIVRKSSEAVRLVETPDSSHTACVHCYGEGLAIAGDTLPVLQTLMNHDKVEPVDDIHHIADRLQTWRREGIYVFANTSTLPGCELATIRFLNQYLPGCFDGMLLPRNHHGTDPLTKGVAARNLITSLTPKGQPVTAIHIDDVPYHNQGYRDALAGYGHIEVATFQPLYPSCKQPDAGSYLTSSPAEAFIAADKVLRQ